MKFKYIFWISVLSSGLVQSSLNARGPGFFEAINPVRASVGGGEACFQAADSTQTGPISLQDSLRRFEFSHPQMGTVFRLVLYARSEILAQTAADRAFSLVDSLNASMSDYLPESELNLLCAAAGSGISVPVSDHLWAILNLADRYSRKTKGAFDASIGPLTRLWRRARNLKELPDTGRVEEARNLVGYQHVVFKQGRRIELKRTGMRLDLGGIAQGYAADRCLEVLRKNGIRQALADAGGDLALGDAPPGESGWAIELPEHRVGLNSGQAGMTVKTLRLANCGITTSGASYRYLEVEGIRYSHIIDPRTGWGLTHHTLVTVLAPTATDADAWATAISVMGQSGWDALPKKPKKTKVWLTESKL